MASLVVIDLKGNQRSVVLRADEYVIGRDSALTLGLLDPKISRRHARLFKKQQDYWLEDLGSINGVTVDGVLLKEPILLHDGANIAIGGFKLTLQYGEQKAVDSLVLHGQSKHVRGLLYNLPNGKLTIGSGIDNDLIIDAPSISRQHAMLEISDNLIVLTDLQSSNGTFVNKVRLLTPTPLKQGDRVRFGKVGFVLQNRTFEKKAATGWLGSAAWYDVCAQAVREIKTPIGMVVVCGCFVLGLFCNSVVQHIPLAVKWLTPPNLVNEQDQYEQLLTTLFHQARSSSKTSHWLQATKYYQKIIDMDPANPAGRIEKALVEHHAFAQQALQNAHHALGEGNPTNALTWISRIDLSSPYSTAARELGEQAKGVLIANFKEAAQKAYKHKNWLTCQQNTAMWLTYEPKSIEASALLTKAEDTLLTQHTPFAPWNVNNPSALHTYYVDSNVRAAVLSYAVGDYWVAKQQLKHAQKSPTANKVRRWLDSFWHLKTQGDNAIAQGHFEVAWQNWGQALQYDSQLLPGSCLSVWGEQMRALLASTAWQLGHDSFLSGQYSQAYQMWHQGLQYVPEHAALQDGLQRLITHAQNLLADIDNQKNPSHQACESLRMIVSVTPPEHATHQAAQKILALCH